MQLSLVNLISILCFTAIAAVAGFIIGSISLEGPNGGWKFDTGGAVAGGMAAAVSVGGLALYVVTGSLLCLPIIFLGALLGVMRYIHL